jgi:hypothetical protein
MDVLMKPIIESEFLARAFGLGMLVCLAASFLVPWISRARGRGYRVSRVVWLALAATLLFAAMHFTMPKKYNIRVDLLLVPLLLLAAWLHAGLLGLLSSRSPSHPTTDSGDDGP